VIIPGGDTGVRCSRSRCGGEAAWRVVWRNPKIHSEDRKKVWLSCPEHAEFFEGYLSQRGFPVSLEVLEQDVS
jgi:hypothetical protein